MFLAPQSYRQRRLIDAARLLPFVGLALIMVPALLLPSGEPGSTSRLLIYLLAVWIGLVLASALIARFLTIGDTPPGEGSQE